MESFNTAVYIRKIDRAESILKEIRQDLVLHDSSLHKSIERGEKDIAEGRCTSCRTKEDLDAFFDSI
jgi:hypothetical protein